MSKKKNTLKDLDEFLKQQAASLVPPEPVVLPESPAIAPIAPQPETPTPVATAEVSESAVLSGLLELAKKNPTTFRKTLYETIVKTLEGLPTHTPEDKMLINTALYLKSGEQWKDVIREYWKKNS